VTLLSQLGYFIDYCRLFSRRTHNNGTGIEDTALLSVVSKSGARDWAKRASTLTPQDGRAKDWAGMTFNAAKGGRRK